MKIEFHFISRIQGRPKLPNQMVENTYTFVCPT